MRIIDGFHVRTLMRRMRIEAIYKKPRPGHRVYPYLLKGIDITNANHVWCSDITCIRTAKGFCYITAIMDIRGYHDVKFRMSSRVTSWYCWIGGT